MKIDLRAMLLEEALRTIGQTITDEDYKDYEALGFCSLDCKTVCTPYICKPPTTKSHLD